MADLDDFFKKRDKKKKSTKTKFSTLDITDEFAKQIEITSIRSNELDIGGGNDGDYSAETLNNIESNQTNAVSATFTNYQTNTNTTSGSAGGNIGGDGNPDEEWKPFDSDENRDYSGLRINQNWKIEDEEENNEDDYADESEKKVACPWAMGGKQQHQQPSNTREEEKKEETIKNESNETVDNKESSETAVTSTATSQPTATTTSSASASASGAYVPPHLRNKISSDKPSSTATTTTTQSSSSGGAYVPPHLRNKSDNSTSSSGGPSGGGAFVAVTRKSNKAQPNINDTLEFPTLDSATTSETSDKVTTNGDERFDYPKRGARVEPKSGGAMIDLENKFTALSNN